MTVEAATPIVLYTVSGIGPYTIPWPYLPGTIGIAVAIDGVYQDLAPEDYTVTPERTTWQGNAFLMLGAALLHAGKPMMIVRRTEPEQGWGAVLGEREKGLEEQLDALTMAQQEMARDLSSTLRVAGADMPVLDMPADTVPLWDGEKFVPGPRSGEIASANDAADRAEAAAAAADADSLHVAEVLASIDVDPNRYGRPVRRLHVADGATTAFAMPANALGIGNLLFVHIDGVAQDADKYTVAGGILTLLAAPRAGERVQITAWTAALAEDANTRRAYAFATRAAMLAAVGWPWEVGAVVSDGTVQYEYIGTGTAISDMPGWVPYGAIYPEHWGSAGWVQGQTASTADDTLRIKPAMDYASGLRQALNFIGGKNYLLNTPLIGNVSHICLQSDSDRNAIIWVKANIEVGIDIFPVDPNLSASAELTNIRMKNLTVWPRTPTSTALGVRLRRVSGFNSDYLTLGGFFNAFKEEGCENVSHNHMAGSEFNLNGPVAGSAWYYRTGILLDGTTWDTGFTTRFNGLLIGGSQANYTSMMQIGSSDVMQMTHAYMGKATQHILVKPDHPTASVAGISFNQVYMDGGTNPSDQTNYVVDGNGYTNAIIQNLRFNHCVFGQSNRGFVAGGNANLRYVSFNDCYFQNMDENAILIGADVGNEVDIRLTGCNIKKWGMQTGGDATKEFFGRILKARNVVITGNVFNPDLLSLPAWRFENVTNINYVGNAHIGTSAMYTYSGGTQRVAAANTGDNVFNEDTNRDFAGNSPVTNLKFGGTDITTLDGTYSARTINWYRFGNLITVNGIISLSAKGTATGVASMTLPVAPVTGQGTVIGHMRPTNLAADAAVPAYLIFIPSNGTVMTIRKYGTTGAPSGNDLTDTAFADNTSINFSITYRVA